MHVMVSEEDVLRRLLVVHQVSRKVGSDDALTLFDSVAFRVPTCQSLGIALAARSADVDASVIGSWLDSGRILRTLSVRGSARALKTEDWGVFNRTIVPIDEGELLGIAGSVAPLLAPLGLPATAVLELAHQVIPQVLGEKSLSKQQLGKALAREASEHLSVAQREVWHWPSPLFKGQTLGESLMRYLMPVAFLTIPVRLDYHQGSGNGFLYTSAEAHTEGNAPDLVSRYLHAYGPSDVDSFARWCGIGRAQAMRLWDTLDRTRTIEVVCAGKQRHMLASDFEQMRTLEDMEDLRLLSPDDPLRMMPMRNLLVHGKSRHAYFFRSDHSPGLVLSDGICVAGWRMRLKKRTWTLIVEDIGEPLGKVAVDELEREAQGISRAIGLPCDGVSITRVSQGP